MKRLEGYGLAIAASILALIASPSNLVGLGNWDMVAGGIVSAGGRTSL